MRVIRRQKGIFDIRWTWADTDTVYGELLQAILDNDLKAVTRLIVIKKANTIPTYEDFHKYPSYGSAFHLAAKQGSVDILKILLKAQDADLNTRSYYNITALHEAIAHLEVVKFLVHQGANINARTSHDETPLYRAIIRQEIETAKYLVKKGANPHDEYLINGLVGSALDIVEGKCDSLLCSYKNEELANCMRHPGVSNNKTSRQSMFFSNYAGMPCDISDEDMASRYVQNIHP